VKLLFAGQLAPARERRAKLNAHAARVADRIRTLETIYSTATTQPVDRLGPLLLDLEQRQLRDR
jgi:hypothetical protein